MFLYVFTNLPLIDCKFKDSYFIKVKKLCSYRTTNQLRISIFTQLYILLNLYNTDFIISPFGLQREYKLPTKHINSYINFICFNLSYSWHCCSKMILKRITCHPSKYI